MAATGSQANTDTQTPTAQLENTNAGVITRRQAAIWTVIAFAIMTVAAVVALYKIDDVKNRDTILYAKFLANLKDRWRKMIMMILWERVQKPPELP